MATTNSPVPSETTSANCNLDARLRREFDMSLKTYKVLKSLLVSAFIFVLGLYALSEGSDPTPTIIATTAAIMVVNGFELSEWVAAREQLLTGQQSDDGGGDD